MNFTAYYEYLWRSLLAPNRSDISCQESKLVDAVILAAFQVVQAQYASLISVNKVMVFLAEPHKVVLEKLLAQSAVASLIEDVKRAAELNSIPIESVFTNAYWAVYNSWIVEANH